MFSLVLSFSHTLPPSPLSRSLSVFLSSLSPLSSPSCSLPSSISLTLRYSNVLLVINTFAHDMTPEEVLAVCAPACRPRQALRDYQNSWLLEFSSPQEAVNVSSEHSMRKGQETGKREEEKKEDKPFKGTAML